jgi:hypothetical protein
MKPESADWILEELSNARAFGESEEILRLLDLYVATSQELKYVSTNQELKPARQVKVSDAGWYQNSDGKLFHYDGVVWDEVPSEKQGDLEFLG